VDTPDGVAEVVAGNNQFAWELYQKVTIDPKNQDQNVFFAPYSLTTALAMTYAGSRGDTAKQMAQTLRFTLPQPGLHQACAALNEQIVPAATKPYIQHVIHQAVIDVNEEGSEAAAVTAVVTGLKRINLNLVFQADHPFVFAIIHQKTGSVLFLGRLADPTQ
jgi:serine protease inhibitor